MYNHVIVKPAIQMLMASLLVLLASAARAQDYVLDPDWPKPLPDDIEWGQVPNVTIDQDGYIYAFHRSEPPVLKFDSEGNLVDTFGSDFVNRPHGFRVTPDGEIWATDYHRQQGHNDHLDRYQRAYPVAPRRTRLYRQWPQYLQRSSRRGTRAPNGDFFVADGHWNNRIVKYDNSGRYLMEWGSKGAGPGQLDLPHSIVRLIVAGGSW